MTEYGDRGVRIFRTQGEWAIAHENELQKLREYEKEYRESERKVEDGGETNEATIEEGISGREPDTYKEEEREESGNYYNSGYSSPW